MNPWTSDTTSQTTEASIQPHHLREFLHKQHQQRARKANRSTEAVKKRSYVVKEKNYKTYNYVGGESEANESDNILSNILVRAMQRRTRRKEIDQAMKIKQLEDTKLKLEEEKRLCEDAKRRQGAKLREMKEAHRLRLLKEEEWRAREVRTARNNKLADDFQKIKLLRRYFQGFQRLVAISRDNNKRARDHYRQRVLQKAFTKLVINRDQEHHWKEKMAASFYNVGLLQKCFTLWKEEVRAGQDRMVSAEHHHHQRLLRQYLWAWRRVALNSLLHRRSQAARATTHYHRTLLRRGLRAWQGYVDRRRAGRRRDLMGSRLRGLVKDIVPDFSPPSSTDDDEGDDEEEEENKLREARWNDIISLVTL